MKKTLSWLLGAALLHPPLAAQESDPLVDLLNNRNYDREAIIRQYSDTAPAPPDEQEPASSEDTDAPAFRPLLDTQLPTGAQSRQSVEALALVLPINGSGTIAAAARIFNQGCVNALNALGLPIRVDVYAHDGSSEQAMTAYEKAVQDQSNFVIGPIQKNNVRALQQLYPQAPVRTLLLQPAGTEPDSAYYVLTIDLGEEAAELARLLREKKYRVLVVADNSAVSRRQQSAFARAWRINQGPPLEYFYIYDPEKDWQKLFNQLKDEKEGAEQEEQTAEPALPPLVLFAAGDGDFIRRTRNFVPQGYALYGSSIFFSDDSDNKFLDNLRMMEMPWFVDTEAEYIRSLTAPLIRTRPALQQRFYALGADSCKIAQQSLLWYEGWQMQGASGQIKLVAGVFRRRGILAQYESGYLKAIGP